ncbi:MAG: hypothetical protein OXB84_04930 [Halobacteriovoraceae bacterium]|nr:hypothetical protein [Halobacteriovoraceae bacterium]
MKGTLIFYLVFYAGMTEERGEDKFAILQEASLRYQQVIGRYQNAYRQMTIAWRKVEEWKANTDKDKEEESKADTDKYIELGRRKFQVLKEMKGLGEHYYQSLAEYYQSLSGEYSSLFSLGHWRARSRAQRAQAKYRELKGSPSTSLIEMEIETVEKKYVEKYPDYGEIAEVYRQARAKFQAMARRRSDMLVKMYDMYTAKQRGAEYQKLSQAYDEGKGEAEAILEEYTLAKTEHEKIKAQIILKEIEKHRFH